MRESVTVFTAVSPKFMTAVKTPVAAPPKRVAMSVFPKTKSFPPSKIWGKMLTICWLLKANSKIFWFKLKNYSNNTDVTDKNDDILPISHANKFLRQSASVNVNQFVFVLQNLYRMSKND